MYSAEKIVHVVNEHLYDIEKDLHSRNAGDVFTKGNCGKMPSLYAETGLSVIPVLGEHRQKLYAHIMSVIDNPNISLKSTHNQIYQKIEELQGSVYDITCGKTRGTIYLADWEKIYIPNKREITFASSRYSSFSSSARLKEAGRMRETRSALLRKLSRHGMLRMKKNPESGLYMPNEDYRQY